MGKYEIIKIDGLYCVFKSERLGSRIIGAYETKQAAIEAIKGFKKEA